jgi:LEA14-like dessication related protein
MRLRCRHLLAGLMVALMTAGCAGAYRQPQVEFEGVRLGGIGLHGGTLYARLMVTNPNRFDLETRYLSYDLEVAHTQRAGEWIAFTQGRVDERVRVAARGSAVIEVPISFRYDDMGAAIRSLIDTGAFHYRVSGAVRLAEPVARTFPYRKQGTVSMAGARP